MSLWTLWVEVFLIAPLALRSLAAPPVLLQALMPRRATDCGARARLRVERVEKVAASEGHGSARSKARIAHYLFWNNGRF